MFLPTSAEQPYTRCRKYSDSTSSLSVSYTSLEAGWRSYGFLEGEDDVIISNSNPCIAAQGFRGEPPPCSLDYTPATVSQEA